MSTTPESPVLPVADGLNVDLIKLQLITLTQFCSLTTLGRTAAWQLARDHEVDVVRIGGRTMFTLESVEALIARKTVR